MKKWLLIAAVAGVVITIDRFLAFGVKESEAWMAWKELQEDE